MTVTTSAVTKYCIQGADRLDPITVFLEDIAPSKGSITVSCFGESWTACWPAMGENTKIADFFVGMGADYIVNCFSRGISRTKFCADNLPDIAKREIIKRRLEGELDRGQARVLYNQTYILRDCDTDMQLHAFHDELMTEIFGQEWWYCIGEACEPNPKYTYLERIVVAVQQALMMKARDAALQYSYEAKELRKDKARLDWLADRENTVGNVTLPTEVVSRNLHSLRAAIDETMAMQVEK